MKYTHSLIIFISTLFLTSCGGGNSTSTTETTIQNTEVTQKTGTLKRSTENSLTTYFHQASQQQTQAPLTNNPTISIQTINTNSSLIATNSNISNTNLQETGVDEADLVKTSKNGQYIYSIDKSHSTVIRPPILETILNKSQINDSDSIRIMDARNTQLTELTRLINTTDKTWNINGLYLDDTENKLIALSSTNTDYQRNWFNSYYFAQQTTELLFFDVTNPSTASLNHTLSFDGTVIDSRRNNDVLYIVLRHFPDSLYSQENTQNTITANDILPHYQLNNENTQALVLAENCYQNDEQNSGTDIITLVAINLASDTPEINSQCYVGSAEAIYASQQSLYLATTTSNYQSSNGIANYEPSTTTNIHKFAYNAMTFDYRGSAEIRGHLGYQQNRKSFRFSEYNGLLRVVTFSPSQWDMLSINTTNTTASQSPVSLTILEEDTHEKTLRIIAQLPNSTRPDPIGLPNEELYASRFLGDKAYFVTFRVTDPLYIIDLSNPTDPFIAGELKVEGYSDYLQPINDTLLLGIGKDAIPSTDGGDGRGAWSQGIKLSLIDISDPNNPREADKLIIGKRGTESNALYNHHALTQLKISDTIQRIALPIRLHEKDLTSHLTDPHPSQYYGHTSTGLHRFEIDIDHQKINMLPTLFSENSPTSNDFVIDHDRSVIIEDNVHYLHNGGFQSSIW